MEPSNNKPWAWIIALLIGGGALFLAWDRFGTGGDSSLAGGQGIFDQIAGVSSPWTQTEETDPMTDEQVLSATRQFEADGYLIDTKISCQTSEAILTYTFTTFDSDGEPAEFKQLLGGTTMNVVPYHAAQLRADAGEPQVIKYGKPRFTNSFELQLLTITQKTPKHIRQDRQFNAEMAELAELASAQNLTVRFPLMQADVVFEIDQTDALVARVIEACLQTASPTTPQETHGADGGQLVGTWVYSDTCATGNGIRFNADGTYEDFGSDEGRYSFDGKKIKFFDRKSVIELDGDETQFVPEPLGDTEALVRDFKGRAMTMNGQTVTKC